MKTNSWIVMVKTADGKTLRHVVEANTRAQAVAMAQSRTGCPVDQAWPATGKYESLHAARVSSGKPCIKV